jgi:acyl-CoA dehydrogenase
MLALWLLALLFGTAFLAHRRTAPRSALAMVAGFLIVMGALSQASVWLLGLLWLLLLAVALPLLLPQQRRSLFTAPLFAWL